MRKSDSARQSSELEVFPRRFRAAEELMARGYPAESWGLLLQNLNDAADELRKDRAPSDPLTSELDALLEQGRRLSPSSIPPSYTREHATWHERARKLSIRILRELRVRGGSPRKRSVVALAVGSTLVSAALLAWFSHEGRLKVHSSADYSVEFPAHNAIDGLVATEWLLPGASTGYVDVLLPRRRAVRDVVVVNSHNRRYMDRATKRARVAVFDDATEVDSAEVRFSAIEVDPPAKKVLLKGKVGTRVRIEVLEYLGAGAGIAEVSVD
jgi:hypothetical protein